MTLRYHCDIEGLEHNWIEVSSTWTRREFKELLDAEGEEFFDVFRAKVEACHVELASGEVIEDPTVLADDALDDIDLRLIDFIGGVMVQACMHLRSLGNASGRLSGNGFEPTEKMVATDQTTR